MRAEHRMRFKDAMEDRVRRGREMLRIRWKNRVMEQVNEGDNNMTVYRILKLGMHEIEMA